MSMTEIPNPLSPRELHVLRSFENGLSIKEIAKEWGIVYGTVKAHIRLINAKLGVSTTTQAVALAIRKGWM